MAPLASLRANASLALGYHPGGQGCIGEPGGIAISNRLLSKSKEE